jgi:1,2-dihydroxy-3-keto-5-methylthiopentene dioxygenase
MSRLRIFASDRPEQPLIATRDRAEITRSLATIGVDFERWEASQPVRAGDPADAILAAYKTDIDRISAQRGFITIDVVSVAPDHPNREELRKKFLDEHFHKEDEVRFFVDGAGLFTLHVDDKVYEVLCEAGDLISVPDGTRHWFDMGEAPRFVAIRFFQQADGWVGHFTGTDIAQRFPRYAAETATSER